MSQHLKRSLMRAPLFTFLTLLPLCAAFPHSELQHPELQIAGAQKPQQKYPLNPVLGDVIPPLTSKGLVENPETAPELRNQEIKSTANFNDNPNLKWLTWNGSLPNGAVGIYNGYVSRPDYICKSNCEAGFHTPSKGPYCFYPYANKEYTAAKFEVLVNEDDFEFLEWKDDSYGSVPQNSVRTCSGINIFVGKNKYGLGKVVPQHEAFFLPWEGDEYWYKKYQVLAINTNYYSQHISHVEYAIDEVELLHYPPETLQLAKVTNLECHSVEKTVNLERSSTVEKTWNIGRETRNGTSSTINAKIPILNPDNVDFSKEQTVSFSKGTTLVETISHSMSVQLVVPPNHFCSVRMEGKKVTADIPFTARLSRTYHDGSTHWTTITGTYDGVRIGELNAVVDRCQPIPDVLPCPSGEDD